MDMFSEAAWAAFTKSVLKKNPKLKFEDAALVKALAAFDKIDESKAVVRLAALESAVEQTKKQVVALAKRKKELGDELFNEIKDKLYDLLQAGEAQVKAATAKAAQAQKPAAQDDEDEESPALLTTRMVPLLRELKKGATRMHALIGTAGKNTAVLIMRRAISTSRRKLLAEALDAKGGAKFIVAECLLENKVLTFVVQASAAGLAKRLRQALLDQTGMRLKIKVRGDDGEDAHGEDEGEGEDAAQDTHAAAPAATIPPAPAPAPALPAGTPAPAPMAAHDAAAAFNARLASLIPRFKEATAASHPAVAQIRAKIAEAGSFARTKGFDQGNRLLDEVEQLLDGTASNAFEARYAQMLPTVTADLQALRRSHAAAAAPAQALVDAAAGHVDGRDFERACGALDGAAEAIASAAGAARLRQAEEVIPAGIVAATKAALEKAQARWDRGVESARKEAKPAKEVLTGSYVAAAAGIDEILDSYRQDLTRLLRSAQQAKEAEVPSRVDATLKGIASLTSEIDGDALLSYLARCGLPVRKTFKEALADIHTLLQA